MVITEPHATRGSRIVACSDAAHRSGIRPGMPLAEARAVQRALDAQDRDPAHDTRALERLARWATRFSPIVGLEEGDDPQSILLDISGCAAFFHGEEKLLDRAARELREAHWHARIAIADTVGAAWGLAHYAPATGFAPPGKTREALRSLPLAALRLAPAALETLAQLGIERVGQLIELPRPSLPARFGSLVVKRLDQALGRIPELIVAERSLPDIDAVCPFEYPTDRLEVLDHALDRLTEQIHDTLRQRGWGARRVECWLYHASADPVHTEIELFRPSRSARHLGMLLRAQLEQLAITEPVSAICLRVTRGEPLVADQADLLDTERVQDAEQLSSLVDRLSNRLGRDAVTRARLVADAQPEFAWQYEPVVRGVERRETRDERRGRRRVGRAGVEHGGEGNTGVGCERVRTGTQRASNLARAGSTLPRSTLERPALPRRPLRLWPVPVPIQAVAVMPEGPPIRFRWGGAEHRVTRSWGPERIETGWWRGRDVHRDYYVVETSSGARFWIFRRHDDSRWFLHGCFD